MTLTLGATALRPCPRCTVHKDNLADLVQEYAQRTAEISRQVVKTAQNLNKTNAQTLSSENGIALVEVHRGHNILRLYMHSSDLIILIRMHFGSLMKILIRW